MGCIMFLKVGRAFALPSCQPLRISLRILKICAMPASIETIFAILSRLSLLGFLSCLPVGLYLLSLGWSYYNILIRVCQALNAEKIKYFLKAQDVVRPCAFEFLPCWALGYIARYCKEFFVGINKPPF